MITLRQGGKHQGIWVWGYHSRALPGIMAGYQLIACKLMSLCSSTNINKIEALWILEPLVWNGKRILPLYEFDGYSKLARCTFGDDVVILNLTIYFPKIC